MKNVIHIYGASGSGTTTLARKIAKELGFTHLDADDYFWLPTDPKYTTKRDKIERVKMFISDIDNADNVVISGSIVGWADEEIIPKFTLAIRTIIDPSLRLTRLEERESKAFSKRIEEGGDMYQTHLDFIEWAKNYDNGDTTIRSKALHDEWEKKLNCPIILIDSGNDLNENFLKLSKVIKKNAIF